MLARKTSVLTGCNSPDESVIQISKSKLCQLKIQPISNPNLFQLISAAQPCRSSPFVELPASNSSSSTPLSGALLLSAVAVIRILISSPLLYTNNSSPPLYTNNSRRVALKTGLAHFSDPVPRPLEKKYFCVMDGF